MRGNIRMVVEDSHTEDETERPVVAEDNHDEGPGKTETYFFFLGTIHHVTVHEVNDDGWVSTGCRSN